MYGQYNLETTESVIELLNGMTKRQSSLECTMIGLNVNWLVVYSHHDLDPTLY